MPTFENVTKGRLAKATGGIDPYAPEHTKMYTGAAQGVVDPNRRRKKKTSNSSRSGGKMWITRITFHDWEPWLEFKQNFLDEHGISFFMANEIDVVREVQYDHRKGVKKEVYNPFSKIHNPKQENIPQ